jgi:shikimate dehydrogenase
MHNAAFAELGMNWAYIPLALAPDRIADAIQGLRTFNFVGANVTIPHKQAIMRYVDQIDSGARAIGAVNTIALREDGVHGYNTDEYGFLQSLVEAGFTPKGARCLILGAGGAARAAIFSLANAGAETIAIYNRTVEKAAFLVEDLQSSFPKVRFSFESLCHQSLEIVRDVDLVVNTTSVGMHPKIDDSPWEVDIPLPQAFIYDLVYNPPKTRFLQQADQWGLKGIDGIDMLVYQGARAFEIWTGQQPPVALMRQIVIDGLNLRNHSGSQD